ncbi:MAG TPA: GMC family oxidoreductase [Ktedonobacterales bacterium]|nr:GMC family oxidoreductase [Ktedonobacterales bacterium]
MAMGDRAGTATTATTTATTGWLTPSEMRTLEAMCEALLPAVPPPPGEDDPHGLYARSAGELGIAALMAETLAEESPEQRAQFKKLLGLLNHSLVGMLLAGRPQGFAQMSLAARQVALRKMSTSSIADMRQGFEAVKRLAAFLFYAYPDESGTNANWSAIGYTPAPPPPSAETAPKRIRTLPVNDDLTLTADAVIVGSGAGGGVMAAQLSAAGKDVVVLEKGGYFNEADFSGREALMMPELYLRRGLLSTDDLGMVVLAGSCLGGGTLVNWSTSLRTPADVLEEWEREKGFSGVTAPEYQRGFDFAEQRMGVNTDDSAPNRNNAALQRGCEALGYSWRAIPRNASDCQQRCGACGFGCPYGRKQSTLLTFLQDANDRGARVVVRCDVRRVLMEAGRAVGVEGWALDEATGERRKVVVRAPVVVVAAGAVESPALLLRSGLTNANIGRHLRLHPVSALLGLYPEAVESWTGSLQTVLSDQFARIQGGYGFRIEVMPAHPGLYGLATAWEDGQQHKRDMSRIANATAFIVLTRDTGEGSVTLDRHGEPVLRYWPNETDRRHLIRGMQETARIIFAGGGVGALTTHKPRLALESEGGKPGAVEQQRLNRFLGEIERRGLVVNRSVLGTAHQMGTCRLGGGAKTAVADPDGQVYGAQGLYIADASGFPTASGVNPMLSIMALSHHVAQQILAQG